MVVVAMSGQTRRATSCTTNFGIWRSSARPDTTSTDWTAKPYTKTRKGIARRNHDFLMRHFPASTRSLLPSRPLLRRRLYARLARRWLSRAFSSGHGVLKVTQSRVQHLHALVEHGHHDGRDHTAGLATAIRRVTAVLHDGRDCQSPGPMGQSSPGSMSHPVGL